MKAAPEMRASPIDWYPTATGPGRKTISTILARKQRSFARHNPRLRQQGECLWGYLSGGADGNGPSGALVLDKAGDVFGATGFGGSYNGGVVFEITP